MVQARLLAVNGRSPMTQTQRSDPRYYANVQLMMYCTIQDFARAAEWAESEIKRLDGAADRPAPSSAGDPVRFGEPLLSLKTVSHFNLGIVIELLLKYFLRWEAHVPHGHGLKELLRCIAQVAAGCTSGALP